MALALTIFLQNILGGTQRYSVAIIVIALSIILSWLTYQFIERPIRYRTYGAKVVTLLVLLMIAFGLTGYSTYILDGFKFRTIAKSIKQIRKDIQVKEFTLRQNAIRSGICHYNHNGIHATIQKFLTNWKCFSDDEGLKDSKMLIFGDSHAADKAMSLKQNGIDVVQIGGASCSINPALAIKQESYCRFLFDLAKRYEDKYEAIILSNSFPKSEITKENIAEIFQYWRGSKPVFLFTPMPNFKSQMNDFLRFGTIYSQPDFSQEVRFLSLVRKIGLPANFKIIKSSDIWCHNWKQGKKLPCSFAKQNSLYMADGEHLSVRGAKIFGRNMISHPALSSLLSSH